jgi:predicted MPP superfamily phosphohydrolase
MKLLVLQLSDIHITDSKNRVFTRHSKIVDALRNLGTQIDLCIVAVTGDIAFSGKEAEYIDSLEIFDNLKQQLPIALNNAVVKFAAIPGNHDCDFSLDTKARKNVINTAKNDNEVDESIVESATIVQRDFFDILDVYFSENINLVNKIYWSYTYKSNGVSILLNCINTAWVSELHERPGNMYYPVDYIPESHGHNLVISLLHHPYNWLSPNNSREFRKKIESVSDIILTGHEHDPTASTTRTNLLQESTHIEAGALQESWDNSISDFNCILIDVLEHKRAILPFKWNGQNYYSVHSIASRWETYQENSTRKLNDFGLAEDFSLWLNDLGLQLKHPQKGVLTREDIFIFPDLIEVGIRQQSNRGINAHRLYDYLDTDEKIIVTGSSDSGKTTLCKELFKHYYEANLIPIYISGSISKTFYPDARLIELLGRECEKTYTGLTGENYRQLERDKHVVIVDDFDKIGFKTGKRTAKDLLDFLAKFAKVVIIVANDVSVQTSEVLRDGFSFVTEGEAAFKQFRLQPFGHVLREQLVTRWMSFDTELDEEQLSRKIHETKSLLDTVIGNNFIPPYPTILLPLLQASQYHDRVDPAASTYGYFYELLINRALTEQANRIAISIKAGYLTYLAKFMFDRSVKALSDSECLIFHREYEEVYDIPVNYREIIPILTETNLLEEVQGGIKFRYEYIYYYYIAKSLSSRLYDPKVQKVISNLIGTIYKDSSANTLLFLTHLTNDQFIVAQMVQAASTVFPNTKPIYKLDNISALNSKELEEIRDNLYQEQDFKVARQKRNEYLDDLSSNGNNEESDEEDVLPSHGEDEQNIALTEGQTAYIRKIGVAMKTLQILGQLLRNHIGNMEGEVKAMLVNECIGIGLRTLNSLILSLEPHKEDFVRAMAIVFQEENPELTQHTATNQALNSLFQVVHNNTYSTIKRISHAIGSPELTRLYDRLFQDTSSPTIRLIYTALNFDNTNAFPVGIFKNSYEAVKDIPLGLSLLKTLTYQQFYLFHIPEKTKQMAFGLFKSQYTPLVGANPNEKLLKKK